MNPQTRSSPPISGCLKHHAEEAFHIPDDFDNERYNSVLFSSYKRLEGGFKTFEENGKEYLIERHDTSSDNEYSSDNENSIVKWKTIADTIEAPVSSVEFKWKIANFSSLPKEIDTFYESPKFNSHGFSWRLLLYPNGISQHRSEDWMELYLEMCNCYPYRTCRNVQCVIGIENVNGAKKFLNGFSRTTFGIDDVKGWKDFLKLDELMRRKCEFYPFDTLTFSIWLQHDTLECFRPVTLSENIGSITIGGPWKQTSELKGLTLLSDNLKRLFLREQDCDVSIKVKGKIFKAHKLILKARSEIIASMLPDDTAEKNGAIEMHDCEPEGIGVVLLYLYTGKIENLSDINMLDVYYVAESYDITGLKIECALYIKRSMTIKNVCSIIHFAKKHGVDEMLNCATDYFTENNQEIILTDEWKTFIKNEPTYGHELYEKVIKTLTAVTQNDV